MGDEKCPHEEQTRGVDRLLGEQAFIQHLSMADDESTRPTTKGAAAGAQHHLTLRTVERKIDWQTKRRIQEQPKRHADPGKSAADEDKQTQ